MQAAMLAKPLASVSRQRTWRGNWKVIGSVTVDAGFNFGSKKGRRGRQHLKTEAARQVNAHLIYSGLNKRTDFFRHRLPA